MFRLFKYAFVIFTFFYLIKGFDNYSYADLALHEIIEAEGFFGEKSLLYISKITSSLSFALKYLSLGSQELADMIYLASLRLFLPIAICFKSYCLFSLLAAFSLHHRHKEACLRQVNMHFQKTLNKYLLFIAFYALLFLLFTAAAETLIYVSCLLPLLLVLLIKTGFLYSGFSPYF